MIQSPTLNGRSSRTVMAPKKFEMESFAARARARPEMPNPAMREVKSKPMESATKTAPTKMITKRSTLCRAEISVFSVPSNWSSVSNIMTTSWTMLTSLNAQTTTAMATTNCRMLGRKLTAKSGINTGESMRSMSSIITVTRK